MKKILLLSVIASSLIMADGDIAPANTPAGSNWKFSGQGVAYYQTDDDWGDDNLFDQDSSDANAGLQLGATNDNLIAGIGFGAELTGLGTLGLEKDVVSGVMQMADDNDLNAAYFSQLYLTYGMGNTSLKVGRQELPKALSPFAYSEDWNVFKNTFNAALIVNTDIPDTVLVGAWVRDANYNDVGFNMNNFNKVNGNDGIWMITAQNKSIENLTLTGSWYYANNFFSSDLNILWADAQYNAGVANIGIQGGSVISDAYPNNTVAISAKVNGKIDIVNASFAYSHVNDSGFYGGWGVYNLGGTGSVLYTEMIGVGQVYYSSGWGENDTDKFVVRADADVLGGNLSGAYGYTDLGNSWLPSWKGSRNEFDLTYSTNITPDLNIAATYVYLNDGDVNANEDTVNMIRLIARYNF